MPTQTGKTATAVRPKTATQREKSVKTTTSTAKTSKVTDKTSVSAKKLEPNGEVVKGTEGINPSKTQHVRDDSTQVTGDINKEDATQVQEGGIARKKPPVQPPKATEFFKLIREGNHRKLKILLRKRDVDVNWVDKNDPLQPPGILLACEKNNLEVAKVLLQPGNKMIPNVNLEDKKGKRAVWWAAMHGNAELVDQLLIHDCDVDILDKESGTTPLYRAILSNSAKVCQLLIHAGANVNLRILGFNVGGESPLMKCVQLDNKEICEVLINSLCNLNAKTDTRYNALHYAVAYRRYDIAELLLTNRIHMHTASVEGVTPMTIAVDQHNAAMCRILVEFGYNMQKKYKWGETPLQHAIKIHSENCAITLVHMGCKLKRPKEENSYFYLAASEGLFLLMKLLLEINPYYVYEKWILERNLPLSLYQKPELFEWLFAKSSQPASLSALCRSVIRVAIGPYPSTQVLDLPLPKKLQEYLALNEYVNEEMYKKIPLTKKECPFDCPSYCPVTARKCPFLDIEGIDYVDSEEEEESCTGHGTKDGHLESPKMKSIINSKEKDALKRGGTPRRVSFKT